MNFQDLIAKSIIQIKESNEFFGALMLFSEFKLSKEIQPAPMARMFLSMRGF